MDEMAYLRTEKETVEMDFTLIKVWTAIHQATAQLEWTEEELDEEKHCMKVKTKGALMSYSSMVNVEAKAVSEKTTRVTVSAETPVTTMTAIVDFGRTKERIGHFLSALAEQLNVMHESENEN